MNAKDIAEFLGIEEYKVQWILEECPEITSLETVDEARALYFACPTNMEPAVMEKWRELVLIEIPLLKTKEEAKELYCTCPTDMQPVVIGAMAKL